MPNIVRLLIIAEYFPHVFQEIMRGDDVALESHYTRYPNLENMTALLDLRKQSNINKPDLKKQVAGHIQHHAPDLSRTARICYTR